METGTELEINGDGILRAKGGVHAAGIGGGYGNDGGTINISGGIVEAHGGAATLDVDGVTLISGGAGVGGGNGGAGGNINVSGTADVTVTGSGSSAGIGGGANGGAVNAAIEGGKVTAKGGGYGTGIGGGSSGYVGTIPVTLRETSVAGLAAMETGKRWKKELL